MRIKRHFIIFLLMCLPVTNIYAGWSGPSEVISETLGTADNQVGFKPEDTADSFPEGFWILGDRIIIRDQENRRMKVYGINGVREKVVNWIKQTNGSFKIPEYPLAGDLAGYMVDNLVTYYSPQQYYVQYSLAGQLIKTSTTRPLVLGVVNSQKIRTGQYRSTVKYPDTVYQITAAQPIAKYYRDANQNLYQIESFTESVNNEEITSYNVHKYNKCSREVSVLNLPRSQYETMPPEAADMPTWKPVPVMEYGEPLVSINGDVYAWARTKTQYKILKWTWVADPNVPTGPEPPTNLSLTPSINGLYLTWKASPNDPGCVTKYEIARATTSGGVFSTIDTVEKGVLKYNDTTTETGTTYYYKVRAMAGSDPSAYTVEVSGKK